MDTQGLLRAGDDRVSTNAECSVTRHSIGLVYYSGLWSVLHLTTAGRLLATIC